MGRARHLFVIAALVLPGCGGDDDAPDVQQVERDLARVVQQETGTGGDVVVDCPDGVEEGDLCNVTATGGLAAKVRVTRLEGGDVEGEIVQP
jgi:hypothetical protein